MYKGAYGPFFVRAVLFALEEEGADVRVRVCPDAAEREGAEDLRPLDPVVDLLGPDGIQILPARILMADIAIIGIINVVNHILMMI